MVEQKKFQNVSSNLEVVIMKQGTENKVFATAATTLIVVGVVLMATRFPGPASSPGAVPQPTTVASDIPPEGLAQGIASESPSGGRPEHTAQSLDPTLRSDLPSSSEDTESEGTGQDIAKLSVDSPPAQQVHARPVAAKPRPAHVPAPPPPIPLKYNGYGIPLGGAQRIFLMNGDDVFIAKEGDIVDGRYKVIRISPAAVEILDLLSNQQQSLPLTQG